MFKFRLEPILRYRKWKEEEKEIIFAEKKRIYETEKRQYNYLVDTRYQYLELLRKETSKEELILTNLLYLQTYIFWLEKEIIVQKERLDNAQKDLESALVELIAAKKEKEVMDKMKEKMFDKYRFEEDRREGKFLDEISSIKFVRKKLELV